MDKWIPFSIFLAIVVLGLAGFFYIRHKVRKLTSTLFGTTDLAQTLSEISESVDDTPRSLNACENSVLPRILEDFPDFDVNLVKTYARDYLKEQFGSHREFTVYNVVLSDYRSATIQKSVVLQAAVSWEEDKKLQKRFELSYTYLLDSGSGTVAANCPNCGGTLGYGVRECPYCGSRVVNVLGNSWEFTECKET